MGEQIKLRAWLQGIGKMTYAHTLDEWIKMGPTPINDAGEGLVWLRWTGLKDKNGTEIYEGDMIARVRSVRTGTRRSRVGRTYHDYPVNSDVLVVGEVRFGTMDKYPMDGWIGFYVFTDQNTSYPSFFWGEGKATDRPYQYTSNLSEPLLPKAHYEIVGNIHQHPEHLGRRRTGHRGDAAAGAYGLHNPLS